MTNRFFDDKALAILSRPERWKLITSFLPPDIRPVDDSRHTRWRRRHTHGHQHVEILFALHGNPAYGFLDRCYPCRPGTLIYFDEFEAHDVGYPPGIRGARHLWVTFVQDRILWCVRRSDRGETLPGTNGMLGIEDMGLHATRLIADCRATATARPAAAVRTRLLGICATVLGRIVEEGYREPIEVNRDTLQSQTIDAIRQHILATGGADASLDNLARISGYSKFHFVRLFKRYTGQSVGRYVNWCRSQKITELRQQGKSWKEIGAILGFSCPAAFCRWRRQAEQLA